MNIVYLTTSGHHVRKRLNRLEVWDGQRKVQDLHLFHLERIVVFGNVQFSSQALAMLLDKGVDVSFLTSHGRLRGSLVARSSRNIYLRLAQFDRWRDADFRLAFSREVVAAKLTAQRRVLARFRRNHPERLDRSALNQIQRLEGSVAGTQSLETLLGLEGSGAAAYYKQFGKMLSSASFPGRKKRPSTDPVNALLSLGYVILGNEISSLLEARGFDPHIGFFHGIRYGRASLSLDVIEPYRQPVVDRLTVKLFNNNQISPADFEGGAKGVRLNKKKFQEYLRLYEEFLRAPSQGPGSPSWRERIRTQVEALRQMVLAGEALPLDVWRNKT